MGPARIPPVLCMIASSRCGAPEAFRVDAAKHAAVGFVEREPHGPKSGGSDERCTKAASEEIEAEGAGRNPTAGGRREAEEEYDGPGTCSEGSTMAATLGRR